MLAYCWVYPDFLERTNFISALSKTPAYRYASYYIEFIVKFTRIFLNACDGHQLVAHRLCILARLHQVVSSIFFLN